LDSAPILPALGDTEAGVREQALRLAEPHLASSASLRNAVVALADDPSPRVRFQLALTLGEAEGPEVVKALVKVIHQDVADPWTQTAVLSSCSRIASTLLGALAEDRAFLVQPSAAHLQFLTRLAALVGARAEDAELASAFNRFAKQGVSVQPWQSAI